MVTYKKASLSSDEVVSLLSQRSKEDLEAFFQIMDALVDNEKKIDKCQEKLETYEEYLKRVLRDKEEIKQNLEVFKNTTSINQRISNKEDAEEMQRFEQMLSEKNDVIKKAEEEIRNSEEELSFLDAKERSNLINNAQAFMSFVFEDVIRKPTAVNVDTHKLNPIKSEIASVLYKYKHSEYPNKPYINDGDHAKQKFIRMIENIVLKPNGDVIHDRLRELYDVYDNWKASDDITELVDWLYSYNIFNKAEATNAKKEAMRKYF